MNYCFSVNAGINNSIIFFQVSMKIKICATNANDY